MEPLRNAINEHAYYCGYTTVFDLSRLVCNSGQLNMQLNFFDHVIARFRTFGDVIPREYVASLPEGQHFAKESWTVSEVCALVGQLKEMLSAG